MHDLIHHVAHPLLLVATSRSHNHSQPSADFGCQEQLHIYPPWVPRPCTRFGAFVLFAVASQLQSCSNLPQILGSKQNCSFLAFWFPRAFTRFWGVACFVATSCSVNHGQFLIGFQCEAKLRVSYIVDPATLHTNLRLCFFFASSRTRDHSQPTANFGCATKLHISHMAEHVTAHTCLGFPFVLF